ncbi:uncharacterized protein LOC102807604 [Saccoglossus kowalevskii]|uniref:Uncharacterized protein LOC102807604 n=1 Tax=Saccoglossus kowalevskii TaxID=10224 RepID=A0ABM0M483_SACKO|nr:PREDICTED: uncharacterized protein LOC102807604 [Saccoglossus kowalevskii]
MVKRSSHIYKLDPVFGEDGLLWVGGRLCQAKMAKESKHQLILPKGVHVSMLILCEIHESGGHFGRGYILFKLREKYWIPNANSATRKLIHNCVTCRRYRARIGEQKMADLPSDRLDANDPPFTRVGLDYFGPIEVKQKHVS